MKRFILATLIILLIATGVQAQDNTNDNALNNNGENDVIENNSTENINNTNNLNNTDGTDSADELNNVDTNNNAGDTGNTENNCGDNNDYYDRCEPKRGKWGVGFELPGIGLGVGATYKGEYAWMIPNTETRIDLLVGLVLVSEYWYGEGNKEPSTIPSELPDSNGDGEPEIIGHKVGFADYYFKAKVTEGILGDHHRGYYWFDVSLEYLFTVRTLAFIPGITGKDDNLYQDSSIIGDKLHHQNKLTASLEFDYSNDSKDEFRRIWGFKILQDAYLAFGSEFDKNFWTYMGFETEVDGWIPIVDKYFFVHISYMNNSVIESFTKTKLPFYAFPKVNNGGWDPVRGIGISYRGLTSNTASIELKTRPLELEKELFQSVTHLDKAISFFSLGAGFFTDFGHVRHPIDYSENLSLGDVIKYSIGLYAETKITILFDMLSFTLHIGTVLYHNDTPDGSGTFSPKFYFAFG